MRTRLHYLFRSTRGLCLLAIGLVALVTAVFATLSGPMAEWGVRDFVADLLGMQLGPVQREGRIISLYHSIAFAVVAVLVYLITDAVPMREGQRESINAVTTAGYLLAMFSGLVFGYFGQNWVFHGLFLVGQSLLFYAGVLLTVALWPFGTDHRQLDPAYARTRGGVDLERAAFFTMALCTLISAIFGAVPGAFFGNGFASFLAEDVVREPVKTGLQKSVIGHLHIMLTLIAVATALLVGRWLDFRGIWHRLAMPLMIFGTVVTSLGAWAVVVTPAAHTIIYAGSVLILLAGLFLVIYGWGKIMRDRLAEQGIARATLVQKLKALLHDPLRFGALWQMVFMNFCVTFVGIFMAVKLDELIRVLPHREERITLTGHWHILAALTATIILFYFADMMGLRGRARRWFGWIMIAGSDVAFAGATIFSMKRLVVSEYHQQGLVNTTMLAMDFGLGAMLVLLALFLLWHLVDLLRPDGRWRRGTTALVAVLAASSLLAGCGSAPTAPPGLASFTEAGADPDAWARVPAGPFPMGRDGEETMVGDFEIMVTPVTNAQFADWLERGLAGGALRREGDRILGPYPGDPFHGAKHEKEYPPGDYPHYVLGDPADRIVADGDGFAVVSGYENHPVTMVTWFGARAYCESVGGRLPTEAEWEKAAKGTTERAYPWGDEITPRHANYYHSRDPFETAEGYSDTTPVGFYNGERHGDFQTVDAASPYGVYDMAGNVAEWTADDYPMTHYRYLRGGSKSSYAYDLRTWSRNSAEPEHASPSVGFRCVR
ncbi:formylglycine-generating enzyme required for sulfatase activity/MFS family permease [Symbiobacterium terraclitae]|uniref:Formylglycine-generating enzyme required for sulfatase activity/MFS family permease n=1 Tax=Symbiobacterium terraclitae TaxID=557451 RepID=A0ABS4JUA5_9FIRM|nr:SUMF1/EgtB/PvdO family nonheme iron enzyme [Symbiobacterium terraclitae]MBP2019118.1 formylglycine-generating enzyme required for sulfatase activity/MFS family permease [Symbiobacterium terraclitae]